MLSTRLPCRVSRGPFVCTGMHPFLSAHRPREDAVVEHDRVVDARRIYEGAEFGPEEKEPDHSPGQDLSRRCGVLEL
jgi:hypothetical protein